MSKNVPELRFHGFVDEWKTTKLKKVVKASQGLQIPISQRFTEFNIDRENYITIPFIEGKKVEYIENPKSSVICKEDDLLVVRTGSGVGRIITGVNGAFHNNFFKLNNIIDLNSLFLFNYLNKPHTKFLMRTYAGTSAIPDLNHGDFYSIDFSYPLINEQNKIASFLSSVDSKIDLLTKKKELMEQYKKGIMQKIFSQEIRFKDDNGNDYPDWEELRAKEVFLNYTNKDHNSDLPILAVTQDRGVVDRNELDLKINSSTEGIKNYKIIEPGCFIISLRSFQGGIELSDIKGLCSPAYTVLKNIKKIDTEFFRYYLKKEDFISRLNKAVIGIRDGKQISYSVFGDLKLKYPTIDEQIKIGKLLISINNKIAIIEKELSSAQEFKKGLLQKMFV